MLRFAMLWLVVSALGCSATASAPRPQSRMEGPGGLDFLVGLRSLPRETWGEVRHQAIYGLGLLMPVRHSRLSFEINGSFSHDDDGFQSNQTDIRGRIWELGGGLRYSIVNDSAVVPYISCGGSALYARIDDFEGDQILDDTTFAPYLRLGVRVDFNEGEYIGLEWRATDGTDLALFNRHDSADYHQFGLVLGASW